MERFVRNVSRSLVAGVLALIGVATAAYVSLSGTKDFPLCSSAYHRNCVVDGDTIRYGGVKIRLADIDAPEVGQPKCASEAALGKQATERLIELINAGSWEITHRGGPDEDRYGRKLRVIERQGRSIGDTLVAEGLARRWDGTRRGWCD
jgi:micrococcal nuclease